MDAVHTINWSAVAQVAFSVALKRAERDWLLLGNTKLDFSALETGQDD
jgi:hypothetical protein